MQESGILWLLVAWFSYKLSVWVALSKLSSKPGKTAPKGASKMAQQIKALAAKPDNLSSIPRTPHGRRRKTS